MEITNKNLKKVADTELRGDSSELDEISREPMSSLVGDIMHENRKPVNQKLKSLFSGSGLPELNYNGDSEVYISDNVGLSAAGMPRGNIISINPLAHPNYTSNNLKKPAIPGMTRPMSNSYGNAQESEKPEIYEKIATVTKLGSKPPFQIRPRNYTDINQMSTRSQLSEKSSNLSGKDSTSTIKSVKFSKMNQQRSIPSRNFKESKPLDVSIIIQSSKKKSAVANLNQKPMQSSLKYPPATNKMLRPKNNSYNAGVTNQSSSQNSNNQINHSLKFSQQI